MSLTAVHSPEEVRIEDRKRTARRQENENIGVLNTSAARSWCQDESANRTSTDVSSPSPGACPMRHRCACHQGEQNPGERVVFGGSRDGGLISRLFAARTIAILQKTMARKRFPACRFAAPADSVSLSPCRLQTGAPQSFSASAVQRSPMDNRVRSGGDILAYQSAPRLCPFQIILFHV